MSMTDPVKKFMTLSPPASVEALRAVERDLGKILPDDYKSFLLEHNGGEGFIGEHYLILWKAEELSEFNDAYEVSKYAPGFFMFGSTGGGEGFVFDTRASPYRVMRVPFIGMSLDYGIRLAGSFNKLLKSMHKTTDDSSEPVSAPMSRGKEIFDIKPVLLGGSPTDLENKVILTREQHMEAVRFWNKVVSDARKAR
jgi:hypothetical protein